MKKKIALLLCLTLLLGVFFTGCSKEFAVETDDLEHIGFDGEDIAVADEDYSATLTADEGFEIIADSVYVEVDGEELSRGWEFDADSGELTIDGDKITGDITIGAQAQESLVGTWTGSVDMTDMLNDEMAAAEIDAYFQFTELSLRLVMTFTEEGTCSLAIDETSVTELLEAVKVQMKDGMVAMLQEQLKAMNVDMSVDELLAQSGMTLDELIDQSMEGALSEDMFSGLETETSYMAKGGMLYIDDAPEDLDESSANPYEISGNTLTIQISEEEDEPYAFMFPLVLKKS